MAYILTRSSRFNFNFAGSSAMATLKSKFSGSRLVGGLRSAENGAFSAVRVRPPLGRIDSPRLSNVSIVMRNGISINEFSKTSASKAFMRTLHTGATENGTKKAPDNQNKKDLMRSSWWRRWEERIKWLNADTKYMLFGAILAGWTLVEGFITLWDKVTGKNFKKVITDLITGRNTTEAELEPINATEAVSRKELEPINAQLALIGGLVVDCYEQAKALRDWVNDKMNECERKHEAADERMTKLEDAKK